VSVGSSARHGDTPGATEPMEPMRTTGSAHAMVTRLAQWSQLCQWALAHAMVTRLAPVVVDTTVASTT
jgi:hypothetical protein